jgi:hypothetical protein
MYVAWAGVCTFKIAPEARPLNALANVRVAVRVSAIPRRNHAGEIACYDGYERVVGARSSPAEHGAQRRHHPGDPTPA